MESDTHIKRLFSLPKVFLEHRGKDEVGQLVGAKTHGATPLVMACRNGHYDVAEYLIEKCGADVEQPGSGEIVILSLNLVLGRTAIHFIINRIAN